MSTNRSSYAISVGHDQAAIIAEDVLKNGGNAVDAGIAATIALTVLHSEQVQLGGVAPMLIHTSRDSRTYSVEGAGRWPAAADRAFFEKHRRRIPQGILRSVVPAAPHAWMTALAKFGTMGFAELAIPAMELARNGFPAHEDLVDCATRYQRLFLQFEENAKIWLPNGKPPELGQTFFQKDLAHTLELMILADHKVAASEGRIAGLKAVTDTFYKGQIAESLISHVEAHGGWLSAEDLANHRTPVVNATVADVFGGRMFTNSSWTQGPALSQALQIIESYCARNRATTSGTQEHVVLEALKLALADREAFYGDPDFVDVPISALLKQSYAVQRAELIDPDVASAKLPAAGKPDGNNFGAKASAGGNCGEDGTVDTSVAAVIDKEGNVFSATPSDMSFDAPAVAGLGFVISTRGAQSYVRADHPATIEPGKRPRVSAYPFIFAGPDGSQIAGGGPGADLQLQAATQVLARHLLNGKTLKDAIKAPRVFTQSAPTSSEPHLAFVNQVLVENSVSEEVVRALCDKGHKVKSAANMGISTPSLCVVSKSAAGKMSAFGDHRRASGQRSGIH